MVSYDAFEVDLIWNYPARPVQVGQWRAGPETVNKLTMGHNVLYCAVPLPARDVVTIVRSVFKKEHKKIQELVSRLALVVSSGQVVVRKTRLVVSLWSVLWSPQRTSHNKNRTMR